jgi:hypothetical protein
MKKIYSALFITLCFAATMSCQKEEDFGRDGDGIAPEGMKQVTLTASSERTKTTISDGHTLWADGDNIAVISSDGSISDPFNLVDGQGTAEAEFNGYIPSGTTPTYAVYPAERCSSVSGSTVKISIPASREGDFGSGNVAVAKVASGNKLQFKNVTAFISFTLPAGTDVTSVVVESVDGSILAGILSIDCSGATPAPTTIESGASSITTTTSSGAGTYYIAIAPGVTHAKGFKMSYKKGDDVTGVHYLNRNITTAVNTNYQMGEVETKGNYYVTVSGAGNGSGMNWDNAMSAEQMWKKLTLAGTDDQIDAAKLASIDGATFHLGAGTYDFSSNPNLSFDKEDPIAITFKGGYNASTGARNIAGNPTDFTATAGSSSLILSGKLTLTLDGINITGNSVSGDKRGALQSSGSGVTINMVDCVVSNNENDTSDSFSGAGIVLSNGTLNATRVTFSGNTAYTAPAIYNDHANLNMTSCVFDSNVATNYCGAVRLRDSGSHTFTCTFEDCTFNNNVAQGGDYGALQHNNGTCNLNNCTFTNNTAANNGGAIGIAGTGTVVVNGGTFSGNSSGKYGGVFYDESAYLNVKDATITGNSAGSSGGMVYSKATCNFARCTVSGNHAQWGGAFFIAGSSEGDVRLQIQGGTISENYGKGGGAILAKDYASIVVGRSGGVGTIFDRNYASNGNSASWGGAIKCENAKNATLSLTGVTFTGNHNDYNGENESFGGALCVDSGQNGVKITIDECEFTGNYTASGAGAAISYQSTNGSGYGDGNGYMHVSNTLFQNNYNNYSGSNNDNYARHAGAIRLGHDATPSTFDNCTFIGNYTHGAGSEVKSAYGGAIAYYADGMSYINNCYFEGNHATRGGAISSWGCTASGLYLNGCSFSENWCSYKYGTTIFVSRTQKFCMNNCSINDNTYSLSTDGDNACWVYVDGNAANGDNKPDDTKSLDECVISNCSIIGSARTSSSLTPLTNGQELVYILDLKSGGKCSMINNAIIAEGTEQYSWWFTNANSSGYNNVCRQAGSSCTSSCTYTSSGDTSNKSKSAFGNLAWDNTNHVWSWNGSLSGGYTAITAADFATQLNSASSSFKTWLEEKDVLNKDQIGHNRGSGEWWPGAYQEGAI